VHPARRTPAINPTEAVAVSNPTNPARNWRALPFVTLMLGLVVGLAVGSLVLAGQDKSTNDFINNQKVEAAIEADVLSQRKLQSDVSCPGVIEVHKGARFTCMALTKGNTRTAFDVVQTNDSGGVRYEAR
jgi:hypothetical protein